MPTDTNMRNQLPDAKKFGSKGVLARVLVPVGIILFCLVALWATTQFERVPPILKRGIQPSDFPQLIIGLIIFLCVLLILLDRETAPVRVEHQVWITLLLMAAFILLTKVDLFLALGIFAATLSFSWGERRWPALISLGAVLPTIVFFLFDFVFKIRFPRGILTSIWYG